MNQDIICTSPVTEDLLSIAVSEFFRRIRPERALLYDYYQGTQPVPKGEAVRGRPNNMLRSPYPRYITEIHTSYFLGIPPTLSFSHPDISQSFSSLATSLQLDHLLFDVARDLSICGVGFALTWLDQQGIHVCRCDPLTCFALRSDMAGSQLLGTVRLFQKTGDVTRGILYTADSLHHFYWDDSQVHWEYQEKNILGEIPLIPFYNTCEARGDFSAVTNLIDAYNLLLSGAMDDMQSVANAFLALYGMQSTTQSDINDANRTRILALSEGGRAEFVVKNLNHEALSQLENNLRRSILHLSMTPDLSDDSFAGNASGVALQYKLWGIEQIRAAKERSFRSAYFQMLTVLSAALKILGSPANLTNAEITFYKNLPQNQVELAETMLSLSSLLSKQTILEQLPWVKNPQLELQRKEAEEKA